MGRSRYKIVDPASPHFMTCTVFEWLPVFTTARQILDYLEAQHVERLLARFRFAKRAHKTDREYQFWQEGCHAKLMFNEAIMREKLNYIHYNPVKRGYVKVPEHWRYSSAANYAGLEGLIKLDVW